MRLSGHMSLMVALALAAACDPGTTKFVPVGGDGQGNDEASVDSGGDAAVTDAGSDAVADTATDGAGDAGTDAVADAGTDAVADTGPDTSVDSTSDGSSDASPDSSDAPTPGVCEGVSCSGEGVCNSSTGAAVCDCGTGYEPGPDPKTCVPTCVPSCAAGSCGSDGCGGTCTDCPCSGKPTALIIVKEGAEVIPQTKLHLEGSQSSSVTGTVVAYAWTVQQPAGSMSTFKPSASVAEPTFEANVAGAYVFRLTVTDSHGAVSCVPGEFTVLVIPDEAIHIELVWDTPGDKDQTDTGPEAGTDLDLHFAHMLATGSDVDKDGTPDGWFDAFFDCYWFNAHPNWGSIDPFADDDPGLDRDDTDGAGPENVNLNVPQDGTTYRLGVHYWSEHGKGPSTANVRVYIYSSLVFETADVELQNLDMWEVATIAWPSGDVTSISKPGGANKIIAGYPSPFSPAP
jgi:hypothetical protein